MLEALQPLEAWVEGEEAFQGDSLAHLALRCSRSKMVDIGTTFVKMIYELLFCAKINR
jgi:hypothetical protein